MLVNGEPFHIYILPYQIKPLEIVSY